MKRQRILVFIMLVGLAFSAAWSIRWLAPPNVITQPNTQLVVSAAASLTDALQELASLYSQQHVNQRVRYNFASSGALQQQIEQGAPVDIFISAAAQPIDTLQQKNLLIADTRRNLVGNRLVLIGSANATELTDLKSLTGSRANRIAIGDPRVVPVGQYAKQALTNAGLWSQLQSNYVLASNVRQVLQFVSAGNADAGLVYLTDAKTTNQVKIVQMIPENLHDPIVYPIALLKNSRNQSAAKNFVQFLFSNAAQKIFVQYGFTLT